jgi:hypothetical protein
VDRRGTIGGPVQRFRWIEPGEFVMGSPDTEPGRQTTKARSTWCV